MSSPPDKKLKKDKPSTSKSNKSVEKSATDKKMEELDQKWSDRFNRLEALLLSKSFPPTFSSTVKVALSHSPPTIISKDNEPFFKPTSSERTGQDFSALHQSASQVGSQTTASSERTGQGSSASLHQPSSQLGSDPQQKSSPKCTVSDFSATKHQLTSQLVSDRPRPDSSPKCTGSDSSALKHQSSSQLSSNRHQPKTSERTGTDSSAPRHQSTSQLTSHQPLSHRPRSSVPTDTGSPHLHRQRKDSASSCSSEASSDISDRPPVDLYVEEGELSDEQDITATETDQTPSAEQTYRETMRGIRSYMGWANIPDVDSSNTASDDNPFSGPKEPVPGKVSVTMPTEDWLCKKLSKLNVTLTEGYPTRSTEAGGLMKDASKLNSCFSWITRQSGLTSTPPASRRLSQKPCENGRSCQGGHGDL